MRRMRSSLLASALVAIGLSCSILSPAFAQAAAPATKATTPAATTAAPAASTPTATAAQPAPASQAAFDPYADAPSTTKAAVATATKLMNSGKWLSAWTGLALCDRGNADPYLLALKTQICIRGYVQSKLHQSFSLVDLGPSQTLEALRASSQNFDSFDFDPQAATDALVKAGTKIPAILSLALGDYYYDIQNLFAEQWLLSDEEVCTKSLGYYEAAAKDGMSDATSLLHRGELLLRFSRNDEAIALINSAIALDPADPESHYTLGLALAQSGKTADSFAEIDKAIAAFKDPERRFNAEIVAARIAGETDGTRSEAYLAAAEKEYPTEPAPALIRQLIAIQLGKADAAVAAADQALDRFPASPYVVRNLLSSWIQANDVAAAQAFLDKSLLRFADKAETMGILQFYKALLLSQVEGPTSYPAALDILGSAEANFHKVYAADNQVFEAISGLRAQLSAKPASPDGASTAGDASPAGGTTNSGAGASANAPAADSGAQAPATK